MPHRTPSGGHVSGRMLALAFTAVVASFVATNFIIQRSSTEIGTLAEDIAHNAAPSIERLERVRQRVLEAELVLSRFIHEPAARAALAPQLEAALTSLDRDAHGYLNLPPVPGEHGARFEVQAGWLHFDDAVRDARASAEAGADGAARDDAVRTVEQARSRVLDDVSRAVQANAAHGRELAAAIRQARHRTEVLADGLHALCAALAGVTAWLLYRQLRARRALLEAYVGFVEERAAEMERFSGRVAHDIRNPLSAARLAAELAARKTQEEPVRELVQRVVRSLSKADVITTDLLEFARSGSRPEPGARTEAAAVIDEVVAAMSPEASRAGIALSAEPLPRVLVACSEGVYLSLLGNLVRNAMKYMGDAEARRVVVRVTCDGEMVRTEVRDTGPGISAANVAALFEPYFRVKGGGADGLGFGLATVKKLAEGHGGRVGVESEPGRGSAFWFELPRAGVAADVSGGVHAGGDDERLAARARRLRAV